jgi:hypothetical protein
VIHIASLFAINTFGWYKCKDCFFAFWTIEVALALYFIDTIALNGFYFHGFFWQVNIFGDQVRGRSCDLLFADAKSHFKVVGEIGYVRVCDLNG